jgi:hypothetical protein
MFSVLAMMDKINHLISMVSALKDQLDQQSQWRTHVTQEKCDKSEEVFKTLPIKDMDEFDSFEKKLEDDLFRKSFVSLLLLVGKLLNIIMRENRAYCL